MSSTTKKLSKESFENAPIAIAAISLGFMSISTALVDFGILWVRHLAVVFSTICLCILVTKLILNPTKVHNEIKNPVAGSIYPTIFMTLMVISVYVAQFSQLMAKVLWVFSLVSHLLVSVMFFTERFKNFKLVDMIPSWFIPTVGVGVAAVTSKPIGLPQIAQVVFYLSLILFVIVGPLMICRVNCMEKIEGPKKPTLMIMVAPANILLAAYIAINDTPGSVTISILATLAYISTIGGYILLPKLIKLPFSPALAPLTFPLAIGVIASQRYVKYLGKIGSSLENPLRIFVYIQSIIAFAVIAYIVYKTVIFLINSFALVEVDDMKSQINN